MLFQQEVTQDKRFKKAFEGVTIYGVAGTNGSGKDTILDLMAERGFFTFNTGDALRQICLAVMGTTQRGGNESPMGRIANSQRAMYEGGMVTLGFIDYWARVLHLPKELQPKGLVIGSIRAVGGVKVLKEFGGKLIVTDADPRVRYERIVGRGREYEKKISFEQFIREEDAEMGRGETDPTKFGMARVIEMGDITISNDSDNLDIFKADARMKLGLK
jgi:dephospho-CoA kinase